MSSPMIQTMFGGRDGGASARQSVTGKSSTRAANSKRQQSGSTTSLPSDGSDDSLLNRVDDFPVLLHVHHGPAFLGRRVERLVQPAHKRLAIVGVLADAIGVMDKQAETRAASRRRPLQHFQIAVGV